VSVPSLVGVGRGERTSVCWSPMPKDGFPIVGFASTDGGLCLVVIHIGVTIAPLIGQLPALEILDVSANCWPTIVRGVSMMFNLEKSNLPLAFDCCLPTDKPESVGSRIYSLPLFLCLGEIAVRVSLILTSWSATSSSS